MSSITLCLDNRKTHIISQLGDDYIDANNYEIRYKCPFCKSKHKHYDDYKLYVNYKSGFYYCQRCQAKGRITFDDAISSESNAELTESALTSLINSLYCDNKDNTDESDYYLIPKLLPIPGTLAYDYLINRGITDEEIKYYSIRVASINDPHNFQGRITIPNKVISNRWTDQYVSRDYVGSKIRYLNPKNNKSHNIVFNLHRIPEGIDKLIINEGVINSIIAGTNSVATFGKYISDSQLSQILMLKPKSLYVSLDTDARELAVKTCERLVSVSNSKVYLVELPDNKDASDLGRDNYLDIVNSSIEYKSHSMFIIDKYLYNA